MQDGVTVALPYHFSLIYETDPVPYLKDGVHVMGVDHRGHVEFPGKVADEAVDQDGCIWIQAGIWLVAEKEGMIQAEVFLDEEQEPEAVQKIEVDVEAINRMLPSYNRIANVSVREQEFEKTTTRKIKRRN